MMPKPRLDKQQIAVANIKLLLDASHSKKKDLAEYMGKVPQSLSKMLQNKQTWFFEDMCTAAEFFGVGIETLVRTDLTPLKAEQILKTAAPSKGNGGQVVAGHGNGGDDLPPAGMGPRYLVQPFSPDLVGNSLISGYTFSDGATPEDYVLAA